MKMKRVTLGFSILAATTAFVLSCTPKKNVAPVADTELESSVYASFANFVASDMEMICSFVGENDYGNPRMFYRAYPGITQTITVVRDTSSNPDNEDQIVISWNNTRCLDGNVRDGSIFMYVPQTPNQRYARNSKFQGRITLSNYKVNGWLVELFNNAAPVYLYNTVATPTINPLNTKLTWKFAGKLKFTHPTDPNKNMVWDGVLNKTLENTSDVKVYLPSGKAAINWPLGIVSYYGHVDGSGPQIDADGVVTPNVGYTMNIDPVAHLVRDFQCSPDKISGIAFTPTVGVIAQIADEFHPFKMGVASFTVGTGYPRQIYYGNEGEPQLELQCDNTGEVLLKGISYRIDFMK